MSDTAEDLLAALRRLRRSRMNPKQRAGRLLQLIDECGWELEFVHDHTNTGPVHILAPDEDQPGYLDDGAESIAIRRWRTVCGKVIVTTPMQGLVGTPFPDDDLHPACHNAFTAHGLDAGAVIFEQNVEPPHRSGLWAPDHNETIRAGWRMDADRAERGCGSVPEDTAAELWRPVVGHAAYEVSNYGRVRRVASAPGATVGAVLKPNKGTSGRAVVCLSMASKVTKRFVHHLVLEAFVGPRPAGTECAHGDGDPLNNRLANLRWDTPRGNAADKVRHGTSSAPEYARKGEDHPMVKLTSGQVLEIRRRIAAGESDAAIAPSYRVSPYAIRDIRRGRSWRHL